MLMPLYEYECLDCGLHFERLEHFNDPHATQCPRGHSNVRRVFSPPAIVFKGPGFYVTDNRKDSGGNRKPGEREEAPKEEAAD
ncbi:MAG TPA: zinc ribbon domain-containing protein [Anaerolineae bacterium]|nr:zinc ribbon domain-containing protein [Anaerolineae bacterium]